MKNLKIKLLAGLCLWMLSIQVIGAFTLPVGFSQVADDTGTDYTQSTDHKLYFHQVDIFQIEPAPQDKISLLPFFLLPSTTLSAQLLHSKAPSKNFSFRDQKHGLKTLIFPFHSFW